MRLREVVGCLSLLMACSGLSWAQSAPPVCEAQVQDLARALVADRLLYDSPGATWAGQLMAVGSQLRIVTTQYKMQQQDTEQAQGQAARQAEVVRQLQQATSAQIQGLQQALDAAHARIKELESNGTTAPQAAR